MVTTVAICIPVFGDPQYVVVDTLDDMYAHTEGGYIEVVPLYHGDMWVNDEYLYIAPERVNRLASDLAGAMGRPDLLFNPIRGNVLVTGPVGPDGERTDVSDRMQAVLNIIANEAGRPVRFPQRVS